MGFIVKPKPGDIYGAFIHLYPRSFQKHYGQTMQQTFVDLLEGESSKRERFGIWVRTLGELPVSAAKEHLTNGRDSDMKNMKALLLGATIAVFMVGLAAFWAGNQNAKRAMGVVRVTSAQLADAMQQDDFYSNYGGAAVLFNGKVASVTVNNDASLVTFNTGRPFNVVCQFPEAVSYTQGQVVAVAAPAGSAERQPHGVLLHDCLAN